MHFKNYERVEYNKNTLFEVVFQARFPQIMKISGEQQPEAFQEIIRQKGYPELAIELPNLRTDVPEEIRKLVSQHKIYSFFSEEGDWKVSLSRDFVALTSIGNYLNYAEFKQKLEDVLKIFEDIYNPSYFTRIGLRYQNIINNEVLASDAMDIRAAIPDYIAPELHTDVKDDLVTFEKIIRFEDKNTKVNVTHAFAKVSGKYGKYQINDKESFFVDVDCFSEQKTHKVTHAISQCDSFNKNIRNIFRWSIGDDIHKAMEPKT